MNVTSPSTGASNQPSMNVVVPASVQSTGVAKEGSSTCLPVAHCQRAPRSPGLDFIVPMATGGSARPLLSGSMRQYSATSVIDVTAHEALPTLMRSAAVSEPNPVPTMVRSVPPANEPSLG